MGRQIRTKWHQFLECYRKDRIQVDIGGGKLRNPDKFSGWDKSALDAVLGEIAAHPETLQHFVFEEDARPLIVSKQAMDTIEVLKKFGKYRLPAPICLAEFQTTDPYVRAFVLCYENAYTRGARKNPIPMVNVNEYPFSVVAFSLLDMEGAFRDRKLKDKHDAQGRPLVPAFPECAVIYPIRALMENVPSTYPFDDAYDRAGKPTEVSVKDRTVGGVSYSMEPVPWISFSRREAINHGVDLDGIHGNYVSIGGYAIRALTAMLYTKGMGRERITEADVCKLNKKRAARRVPTIPEHVYIHIASYTNKEGNQVSVGKAPPTGRKQRFHMRSAHVKQQPYGPGRSLRKQVMIDAYLVNEDDGGDLYNPVRVVKA